MSVRFILGRAGSGKTRYCLEAVRKQLADPSPEGPVYLLVPEQSTAITERQLVVDGGMAGYVGNCVVSFRRLAHMAADRAGCGNRGTIGPAAARSLITAAVDRVRDRLEFYGSVADRPGFASLVESLLREMGQSRVTPGELAEKAARRDRSGGDLAKKTADLALIHEAFLSLAPEGASLPASLLDGLAEAAGSTDIFAGASLWVDGFAGFTGQEQEILVRVSEKAAWVEIALNLDPASIESPEEFEEDDGASVFAPVKRAYRRLATRFRAAGIPLKEPVILPREGHSTRFSASPGLEYLERAFAEPAPEAFGGDPGIVVAACADRRTEVRWAADEILRRCRDGGYRYRDVGVLVRDLGKYEGYFETEFAPRGIPYFCDVPRRTLHHPLPSILRSALDAVISGWRPGPVLDFVGLNREGGSGRDQRDGRTPTGSLEKVNRAEEPQETDPADASDAGAALDTAGRPGAWDAADRLAERARERGIRGDRWWDDDAWKSGREADAASDQALLEARDRILEPLRNLETALRATSTDGEITVRDFCATLFGFLDETGMEERLRRLTSSDGGDDTHREVWEKVLALFDEWVEGAGSVAFSLEELARQLATALANGTLRRGLPNLDQVMVGSIEHSRQPDLRAAIVLGLVEREFPRPHPENRILSEDERTALEEFGIELGSAAGLGAARERYLGYVAFTRPRDALLLSYPRAEADGSDLYPSPWIEDLKGLFPALEMRDVPAAPVPASPGEIVSERDLVPMLVRVLRKKPSPADADRLWAPLLRRAAETGTGEVGLPAGLLGLEYDNEAKLGTDLARRLADAGPGESVTSLESLAACPFQYLASHLLRLREPREYRFDARDVGTVCHAALEDLFVRLREDDIRWKDLDDGTALGWIDDILDRQSARVHAGLFRSTNAMRFQLDRIRNTLSRLVRSLRRRDRESAFHQEYAELVFGREGSRLPAFAVDIGEDRSIGLQGKIDRLDVARTRGRPAGGVLVIDFKTSADKLDFGAVYHGLALQLLTYLLVTAGTDELSVGGESIPVGAVYLPIFERLHTTAGPGEAEPSDARRAVGVVAAEWIRELDTGFETGKSNHFTFGVNKDGVTIARASTSDAVPSGFLLSLMERTRENLGTLGAAAKSGKVDVQPALHGGWTPCTHCKFRSVCRFEREINDYRFFETMNRKKVREALGEG